MPHTVQDSSPGRSRRVGIERRPRSIPSYRGRASRGYEGKCPVVDPKSAESRDSTDPFESQVDAGGRFEFGENWRRFLSVLDDERISEAERSLTQMLGLPSLEGRTFLDVGSGSGLFSLAAMRLGATRVHSVDFDPSSVACTEEVKRRWMPAASNWTIERADILDGRRVATLGQWDIVYSWGVLHHTGDMRSAMENVCQLVAAEGRLFLAIYNDQGMKSRIWRRIKWIYNALPRRLRAPYVVVVMAPRELLSAAVETAALKPSRYVRAWTEYKRSRGMSRWHDLVDWVGGYPFEVAKPEDVFSFYRDRGFALKSLVTAGGGLGCNQYVFQRAS